MTRFNWEKLRHAGKPTECIARGKRRPRSRGSAAARRVIRSPGNVEKSTFHGSLDRLKDVVVACGLAGEWTERPANGLHCFRAGAGEVLNWWPRTGTLLFQGKRPDVFRASLTAKLDATAGNAAAVHSGYCERSR